MVYGFGKGVRALDDEQTEAAGREPSLLSPKSTKLTKTISTAHQPQATGAATRWISKFRLNPANMPAFSSDDNLEPSTFPSESDYPPRHIRMPEPVEESEPVVQDQAPVDRFSGNCDRGIQGRGTSVIRNFQRAG